jgi:hypothetical protein
VSPAKPRTSVLEFRGKVQLEVPNQNS